MNEEIQKWLLETLQQTKDLLIEQAPDVVQQLLGFAIASNAIAAVAALIAAAAGVYGIRYSWKRVEDEELWAAGIVVGGLIAGVGALLVPCFLVEFVHAYFFPKAYLLHLVLK